MKRRSNTTTDRRGGLFGNFAVGAALVALGVWLSTLQHDAWWLTPPPASHWIGAGLAILAYAGFVAMALYRSRPRNGGEADADASTPTTLVVWASQTGFAQQLAQRSAQSLADAGQPMRLLPIDRLDLATLATAQRVLFVASTTGEGDPPDHALGFVREVLAQPAQLHHLEYAVLALGDREYADFCAFGHRLDAWLRQHGARALFDLVEVDNADAAALRHWQHQLGLIGGDTGAADWEPAKFDTWTLRERRVLNPGSLGAPVFHLELAPPPGARWQAGDIAEIRVAETPQISREYSIASLPAEGGLKLLVRRQLRADGTPGIGSGWLCDQVPLHGDVAVRLRANPNFRAPTTSRPLVLIGNGTGIAGLRALLAQRVAEGARRNWLLFGERQRQHDFLYREDIERWQAGGCIERLDLAFSRDGDSGIYVQDALRANADTLREWATQGAAVYICGGQQNMAPAVDAVLRETMGNATIEAMLADGRYRRDVY